VREKENKMMFVVGIKKEIIIHGIVQILKQY
jgi:hypothetical protein